MSPTATTTRAAAKPAATPTFAYAGKLLRVNLSTGKTWTEAWSEKDRREYVGGIGLGAKILYEFLSDRFAEAPAAAPRKDREETGSIARPGRHTLSAEDALPGWRGPESRPVPLPPRRPS